MDSSQTPHSTPIPQQTEVSGYNHTSKSKIPLILGIVLMILLTGIGSFVMGRVTSNPEPVVHKDYLDPSLIPTRSSSITPSSVIDETVNWLTYSNEKYGISFRYPKEDQNAIQGAPSGCERLDTKLGCVNPERFEVVIAGFCKGGGCDTLFGITVYYDPNNKGFINLMQSSNDSQISETTFAGLSAKKVTYNSANVTSGPVYYIKGNQYGYVISGAINDSTFNKILSSFKFIGEAVNK